MTERSFRLAVLGAGEVGTGWAALALAAGRRVTMFDPDARALERALEAARTRAAALAEAGLAPTGAAYAGDGRLEASATLEKAAADADWIMDATPESAAGKRAVLVRAEAAAGPHAVLATSSSGLHASTLGATLQRPARLLVVHPLVPVELIPVVEVVPGPGTAPEVVQVVRDELTALGRVPIVLRREVSGNAVGRIAAAVWRECIDLVLEGVLDPAEADRLVAEGPCLGWAAGGPHLTYELAAGRGGMEGFLAHLLPTVEDWWAALSARTTLTDAERVRLTALVEGAYGGDIESLRERRDRRLAGLVAALRTGAPAAGDG